MKTKQLVTHLAAAAFCCALGSSALSAATTTPVGAVSVTLPAGNQVISVPFLTSVSYQGPVTNVSSTTITVGSNVTVDLPAYVLVGSGSAEGEVTAISSINGNEITLESAITDISVDDTISVREFMTLADFSEAINAVEGDLVTLYNTDGSLVVAEYFDGYGWYDANADANADTAYIYPGEAISLNAASSRSATFVGSVSDQSVHLDVGGNNVVNLVGSLDPVSDVTVSSLLSAASEGDLMAFVDSEGGSVVATSLLEYFDGFGWYDTEADQNADNYTLSSGSGAVFQSSTPNSVSFDAAY